MKQKTFSLQMPASKLLYVIILLAGTIANISLSPKWVIPVMAWVAPALFLFYFRHATIRFRILWFLGAYITGQMISSVDVAPFPLFVMAIIAIINTAKVFVIYLLDRWVNKKSNHFLTTLVFPALYVTKDYIDSTMSGGAWESIANTQYNFHWLVQLSSVTGILGISFAVYWFASVMVWCIERYFQQQPFTKGLSMYITVMALVLMGGAFRYYSNELEGKETVRVAGITVPNLKLIEGLYKDVYSKEITIDQFSSLSSPKLQEANTALIPFIENPDTAKFINGFRELHILNDSLFALSRKAVVDGAKMIVWSEANAILPHAAQDAFIARAMQFANANKVYLLAAMGVFDSGKITPETNFLENKTILFGPDGTILNVFHKNHPVPFAERSMPGDGKIPAIATPYGIVATSICYDADFATGMRQVGEKKADVLFLPSGDWHAIAPYHSYMAMFRGIENGCTVVRQVSGGLSLVSDYRGRQQFAFDYFKEGEKYWVKDITVGHVGTLYTITGDLFAYLCIAASGLLIAFIIIRRIRK